LFGEGREGDKHVLKSCAIHIGLPSLLLDKRDDLRLTEIWRIHLYVQESGIARPKLILMIPRRRARAKTLLISAVKPSACFSSCS
jgi:hypothetical protein